MLRCETLNQLAIEKATCIMATRIAYGIRPQEPVPREKTPPRKKQVQMEKPPRIPIPELNRERERDEPRIARSIIGTDDRLRITPSSPLPWKSICRLRLHFPGMETKIGTGFLILGDTLLTAGHNLYKNGQFAESTEVYAGINGDFNSNFGTDTVDSSRLRVHEKYKAGDIEFDYGIIILNKALGAGSAGVVRMQVFSQLTGLMGVVSGYPADIPNHAGSSVPNDGSTQWYCSGPLRQTSRQLFYDSDTTSGESGGPVLVLTKVAPDRNEWCAVGIHAYGVDDLAPSGNSATLITNEVIAQIRHRLPVLAPTV